MCHEKYISTQKKKETGRDSSKQEATTWIHHMYQGNMWHM